MSGCRREAEWRRSLNDCALGEPSHDNSTGIVQPKRRSNLRSTEKLNGARWRKSYFFECQLEQILVNFGPKDGRLSDTKRRGAAACDLHQLGLDPRRAEVKGAMIADENARARRIGA